MTDKIDRNALKGPDEFTRAVTRTTAWANEHRRGLAVILAGLVVVLLAGSVAGWNRARRNQQAVEQFRQAHAAFQAKNWTGAAEGFDLLIRDYPGTPFGRLAPLYLGHAGRAAGDATAAIAAYERFLEAPTAPEQEQLALLTLGQLREAANETDDALDLYTRASAVRGPYDVDAELGIARMQAALGHSSEAKAAYEKVLATVSGETKALVEAQLAALARSPE